MGLRQLTQLEAGYVFVKEVRKMMVVNARKARLMNDVSTWEVPHPKFKLIPDNGLRRKPKGQSQVTQIHNDMDIKEPLGQKHCGICRTVGHIRNKCPHKNYHLGQSSRLGDYKY
ncbi:hypothetical protein GOBAR_DD30377 [Gossypium barbadense]|nr:hypothetical protein GOBAR_DD30377 [Gossypium barbadense]